MAKKLHLVHVKSNVLDKAPSASTISYGEIAVNYNVDSPALYIKDDEDNIVKFISEPYFEKIVGTGVTENDGVTITPISEVIQEDEEVVSAALNDLNNRKADKSDLDDAISGLTEYIDEQVSAATIEVDSELDSGSTNPVENRAIWKVIVDNELIVSSALNDLNDNKADRSELSDFADINDVAITGVTQSGSGNAVTAVTVSNKRLTVSKGDISGGGGGLPDVTSTDNGKILKVVNGVWTLVDSIVTYAGETNPPQTFGNNGDIFLQI